MPYFFQTKMSGYTLKSDDLKYYIKEKQLYDQRLNSVESYTEWVQHVASKTSVKADMKEIEQRIALEEEVRKQDKDCAFDIKQHCTIVTHYNKDFLDHVPKTALPFVKKLYLRCEAIRKCLPPSVTVDILVTNCRFQPPRDDVDKPLFVVFEYMPGEITNTNCLVYLRFSGALHEIFTEVREDVYYNQLAGVKGIAPKYANTWLSALFLDWKEFKGQEFGIFRSNNAKVGSPHLYSDVVWINQYMTHN